MAVDIEHVDADTAAWALENARGLLRDESARLDSLDARAGQVAGFSGVVLAILGSMATEAFAADLGGIGDPVFAVLYAASLACLATAMLLLVYRVLRPRRFVILSPAEIANYIDDERLLRVKPAALQVRTLRSMADAATWAEEAAEAKAKELKRAISLFAIGLSLAVAGVGTLAAGSV